MILKKCIVKQIHLKDNTVRKKSQIRVKGGLNPIYFCEFSQVIKKSASATHRRGIF